MQKNIAQLFSFLYVTLVNVVFIFSIQLSSKTYRSS